MLRPILIKGTWYCEKTNNVTVWFSETEQELNDLYRRQIYDFRKTVDKTDIIHAFRMYCTVASFLNLEQHVEDIFLLELVNNVHNVYIRVIVYKEVLKRMIYFQDLITLKVNVE